MICITDYVNCRVETQVIKFHDEDLWDLDVTLARVIIEGLRVFRKRNDKGMAIVSPLVLNNSGIDTDYLWENMPYLPKTKEEEQLLVNGYSFPNSCPLMDEDDLSALWELRYDWVLYTMIESFDYDKSADTGYEIVDSNLGRILFALMFSSLWT